MPGEKRKIVIASRNEDKIRELSELCQGLPFEVGSALDYPELPEVIEDGTSILGNACRKAIVVAAYTGEIAVADDTALQVPALNELPDIFSSRFAGPGASYADNAALVLDLMRDAPDDRRQARFVTATVWVDPRPEVVAQSEPEVPPDTWRRWLHNPFARAIHIRDPEQEPEFWNGLADRRRIWANYLASRATVHSTCGPDQARLEDIHERLLLPFLAGGRPTNAPPEHMQLPDTRIWTAATTPRSPRSVPPRGAPAGFDGSDVLGWKEAGDPPTLVAPSGLPADAPGHELSEPIWLELATEGRLLGEITRRPVGLAGFGYDPIFRVAGDFRTLAELSPAEKNAVSHRGRALRQLLAAARDAYRLKV